MPALAKVILVSVHHHGAPDDGVLAHQGDHGVRDVHLGAPALRRHVAQVPGVPRPLGVLRGAVAATVRVEVRPGAGAAVGVVSELSI